MKRAALILAFLSAAALAGCGVGDAGRWLVTTSLRSAYGCSLLISSDQAAVTAGDREQRPQPLLVADPSIVASSTRENAAPERVAHREGSVEPPVEIARLPISRDLSSIGGAGTMRSQAFVRLAEVPPPARVRISIARPQLPGSTSHVTVCTGTRG